MIGRGGDWFDGVRQGLKRFPGPAEERQLTAPQAPHETAAVLRMHRAGMSSARICGLLKISKAQLVHEMNAAIDDETSAHHADLPIHDAGIEPPHPKAYKAKCAKDVMPGEYLVAHSAYVWTKNVDGSLITFTLPTGERVSYGASDKLQVSEGTRP